MQCSLFLLQSHSYLSEPNVKEKWWKWSNRHIEALLISILECKKERISADEDFTGDLTILATDVRLKMARQYPKYFGPVRMTTEDTTKMNSDELKSYKRKVEEESRRIKIGYVKVREKYKLLRSKYNEVVISGRQDKTGDHLGILSDHWEKLESIWGDCSLE